MSSKYTIIIPSRYNSSRLPGKSLEMIGDKPMVVQVALEAKRTHAKVVVATDDGRIADVCQQFQIEYCLAQKEHVAGTDRVAEAAQILGLADDEVVINVQGDEPFMPHTVMQEVADALFHDGSLKMATAAHNLSTIDKVISPAVVKVVLNARNTAMYFSRAPIPWHRDGWGTDGTLMKAENNPQVAAGNILKHLGIYGFRVGFLKQYSLLPKTNLEELESLEQLRALYNSIDIYVVKTNTIPAMGGVDNPSDLAIARGLWEQR
jgi:3-deoxy-manno-octulosonate cytidylyltransferase (CMP-KDO synthetase)